MKTTAVLTIWLVLIMTIMKPLHAIYLVPLNDQNHMVFKARENVPFIIQGVVAPVFTPMKEDGQINLDVIPSYAGYLLSENVKAILIGGTTGEAALLSLSERKALLQAWIKVAQPAGMKIISQVGGQPIPDVLELAKFSEQFKADAIMTLPELYFKPTTVEQLVSYLEVVSNAAPSLPLIYYHFPKMTGVDFNMKKFFAEAKSRIYNFKGMKADLNVAEQVADLLDDDQRVYIANHHLAPAALMGHTSSIATVTNIFPSVVHDIVAAVKSNNVTEARDLQKALNRLVDDIAFQGEFVPTMKAAMEKATGIKMGPPRFPLKELGTVQKDNIAETLRILPTLYRRLYDEN